MLAPFRENVRRRRRGHLARTPSSDDAGGDGTTGPGGLLNATGRRSQYDPYSARWGQRRPTHRMRCWPGSPALDRGNRQTAIRELRGTTDPTRLSPSPRLVNPILSVWGDVGDIGSFEVPIGLVDPLVKLQAKTDFTKSTRTERSQAQLDLSALASSCDVPIALNRGCKLTSGLDANGRRW